MKILHLARHAKSSRADHALSDFERPLNDRGRRDAPVMGGRIARPGRAPEVIIAIPALRALTTARLLAAGMGLPESSVVESAIIYGAGPATILEAALGLGEECHRAMIVGHNPGMTLLAAELSRGEITHMPTCAIATFEFPADHWKDLRPGKAKLLSFDTPRPRKT